MKYTMAGIVLCVLGLFVLGASELHANRAEQQFAVMQRTVSALSPQDLASARRNCKPQADGPTATIAYCAEVQRALDGQPLLFVVRPPAHVNF